jgi:peptide/nickel transport system substrate-binding protein
LTVRGVLALAVAVALLAAAGCMRIDSETQSGAQRPGSIPGTLRYADVQEVEGLNPLLRIQAVGTDLDMFVYGFFFNLDNKMRFVPELATEVPTRANGGISADGLTLTYHLRSGVRWQDGAPFTARDVVFTTQAILNPKNNVVSRTGWDDIADARAVGDHTVRFRLKKIYAPAVATFFCESGLYPILPAHLLAKYPDINHAPFNDHPVGTGPFRFVRWVHGDHIELEANPLYWRGRPKLDRIVYKFVPAETTILTQLKSHELDAWFRAPSTLFDQLSALPDYRLAVAPSLVYAHLDLNQKNPLFDDVDVRRAINYAIDRETIIDKITHGVAEPAYSDVSPLSWAYDPHVVRYAHDPAKSRALLRQAGWAPGPDGVMKKNDTRLSFALSTVAGSATGQAIEALLQQDLREVGIEATVKNYPSDLFFGSFADNGILYRGKYDAALFSWAAGVDPDDSSEYLCDEIPPAGQNDLYWCDDRLDSAERGALSSYDRPVRKPYYAITQEELASQSATIFLYFARQLFVTSPDMRGFVPAPATSSNWNTWEWSI